MAPAVSHHHSYLDRFVDHHGVDEFHHFGAHEDMEEYPHHEMHSFEHATHHSQHEMGRFDEEPYLGHLHEGGHQPGYNHGYYSPYHEDLYRQPGQPVTAEYDYFAGMFSKPKTPPKTTSASEAQPKLTSLPAVKQPATASKEPASTPVKADAKSKTKPLGLSKPANELYGDAKLPDVPPTTPYEHDLAHSYWDKQYAQAEHAIQELYPYTHTVQPGDRHHHFLSEEGNESEYLALYGASELFG